MIRPGKLSCPALLMALLAGALEISAATHSTPAFQEVYEAIQSHAAGLDAAELNRAAVAGLLKELGPKAALVSGEALSDSTNAFLLISKTSLFDGNLGYLRLGRVSEGVVPALREAYQPLAASNKLAGVVLDLRFCDGADYGASVAAAELFSLKKMATLDWGRGGMETKAGAEMISPPLVVLVNGQTRAAAETLAALLRETGAGLILGNPTAGHALLTQDFPLASGAILRVATASVKLNGQELSPVRPDIAVAVTAKDEQTYFADAFLSLPGPSPLAPASKSTGTNSPARRQRLTEAALVRAHKQGLNPEEDEVGQVNLARSNKPEGQPPEGPSEVPVVSDPVLARALDLLKGLAIVRHSRL